MRQKPNGAPAAILAESLVLVSRLDAVATCGAPAGVAECLEAVGRDPEAEVLRVKNRLDPRWPVAAMISPTCKQSRASGGLRL